MPRGSLEIGRPPIPGRHGLRSELGRYLIVFDPLTFVLDRGERAWQTLSQPAVFRRSKNFTSDDEIRVPPSVSVHHDSGLPETPTKRERSPVPSFHAYASQAWTCARFEHSDFFKVKPADPVALSQEHGRSPRGRPPVRAPAPPRGGGEAGRRRGRVPTTSFLTATTLIYAIGAGITAGAGTRLVLQSILVPAFAWDPFRSRDPVEGAPHRYLSSLPPRLGIG